MARIRTGGLAAQLSGSVGGITFSHGRYGAYTRSRSIPTNPNSVYQAEARNLMAGVSGLWKGLTAAQQESWRVWATTHPVMDPFGDSQILSGQAAHNMLNCRIKRQTLGVISVPPTGPAPPALNLIGLTADIGAGNFEITFNASPLAADCCLWVWGTLVNSPGIRFVRNKLVLFHRTGAAAATPVDLQAAAVARFGTLTVGAWFHVSAVVLSQTTGLVSTPLIASSVISTT